MLSFLLLQAALVSADSWCGLSECPALPKCTNSEVDIIIALDQSCSMSSTNWGKELLFAATLVNLTQNSFNSSRFAGIIFGANLPSFTPPVANSSVLFHQMQPGASGFLTALDQYAQQNCGGTPTDEALDLMYNELARTRIPGRMQIAVLSTDGIPTLCSTDPTCPGACDGQCQPGNVLRASNDAIIRRWAQLPSLGEIFMTIGIGSAITNQVGNTDMYGSINGQQLLTYFATSSRFAFFPSDFNVLLSTTLGQVLDELCFYLITVVSPCAETCYSGGTVFQIEGYNMFSLGQPMCRWQQVNTQNFLYTNASITATNITIPGQAGIVGLVTCLSPVPPPCEDPYQAVLEISRDGTYYTNNQYTVLLRNDCGAPIPPRPCPNATIMSVLNACVPADIAAPGKCSPACSAASAALAADFAPGSDTTYFPAFNRTTIPTCFNGLKSSWPSAWSQGEIDILISLNNGANVSACVGDKNIGPGGNSGVSGVAEVAASSFVLFGLTMFW